MIGTVGMIGLGLMGQAMVARLRQGGHHVLAYDVRPGAVEAAVGQGAEAVPSPGAMVGRATHVLICVTDSAAVEAVIQGPDGLASGRVENGLVVVDMSTTDLGVTAACGAMLRQVGVGFVDAPVSGGPPAAAAGTLAIMAGGEPGDVERARTVLDALGSVAHMGGLGAGQATKLVNQALVLTNYCVIAEAVRLAQAFGVDATRLPDALKAGHAGSNLLPVLVPRMVEEDFAPRGLARQVLKDLEMLNAAAKTHHLAMPMASQAMTLYRLLVAQGQGERDGSAVVTLFPKVGA